MRLTLPPSSSCRPSPRRHVRRVGSRFGRITARHLPGREPGLPPALCRAVLVDDRTELYARFAKRPHRCVCAARFPHSAPARSSTSRVARCDTLHLPCRDFSSRVTSFPRYRTKVSGRPVFTPRFLRIAPAVAEDATGSVAVANVQLWSSHLSSREDSFTCSCHSSRRDTVGVNSLRARWRRRTLLPPHGTVRFL